MSEGVVYIVEGAGLYKVGSTKTVARRLEALQTGSPVLLSLIHTIEAERHRELESRLHGHFDAKRERNEWFRLDAKDLEWLRTLNKDSPLFLAEQPIRRPTAIEISQVQSDLGRIKSKAKAAASRANGKKGGRPKGKKRNGTKASPRKS